MPVPGGMNLSQGQRQLPAIARAILEDPDILVSDETASSVGTMTKFHIQRDLNNLMKGRTSFVIARRLKTFENTDQTIIIKGGTIIEQGNTEALIGIKSFYTGLQN